MYSTYSTNSLSTTSSASLAGGLDLGVWGIVALVLAIVGALVGYFLFIKKKNNYKGFLHWAHDFLNFKRLFIEAIMKIGYAFAFLFVTLGSFGLISTSFVLFLIVLIGGNIALRVIYEFMMLTLIIVRNTTDINKKLSEEKKK